MEVARKHRKFLHFAFHGVVYEYNRLPFGYSVAPCTFKSWAIFQTAQLILHLNNLGFAIN